MRKVQSSMKICGKSFPDGRNSMDQGGESGMSWEWGSQMSSGFGTWRERRGREQQGRKQSAIYAHSTLWAAHGKLLQIFTQTGWNTYHSKITLGQCEDQTEARVLMQVRTALRRSEWQPWRWEVKMHPECILGGE